MPQSKPGLVERYCVNCVHHVKRYDVCFAPSECDRPLSDRRDPVTGALNDRLCRWCDSERRSDKTLFGRVRCGPGARFFEPITTPTEGQPK